MHRDIISRAVILVSVFVLWFAPYHAAGDILSTQQEIESLIEANKLTEAQTQIDKLKADYSQDSDLPETLYWIAERYRWQQKWEQANNLHNQIIQDYPDSISASRANLAIARAKILSLIADRNFGEAEQALDKLVADFPGHQDLPDALYWIAEAYRWNQKQEKAISIYQQIVQNYPDSPFASKSRLGLVRTEILSLIENRQYEQADEAIETMVNDFTVHQDLPETLFWIAEGYRWASKSDKAKGLYQQIIQDYPYNSYADRAKLGLARQEVVSLIVLKNFGPAEKALDKLISDFAGELDLPQSLFWIGRQYEWKGKYEEANRIHKLVVSQYPGSTFADEARLGVARMEVGLLIYSGKTEEAQAAVEKIKTDFAGHHELAKTLYEIAGMYDYVDSLKEAIVLHDEILSNFADDKLYSNSSIQEAKIEILEFIDANDYITAETAIAQMKEDFASNAELPNFLLNIANRCSEHGDNTLALGLYEDIMDSYSNSEAATLVCTRLINYYIKQKDYEYALVYAQRLYNDWPNSEHAWYGLFTIGELNERMKASGLVGNEVDYIIKTCYKDLVEYYPDCYKAKYAAFRLAQTALKEKNWTEVVNYNSFLLIKFETGEEPAAVLYPLALGYDKLELYEDALETYKLFITKSNTTDPRRNDVLKRIAELEELINNNKVSFIILSDTILSNIYGGCDWRGTCKKDPNLSEYPCSTNYSQSPCSARISSDDCTFVGCNCKKVQKRCQNPVVYDEYDCICTFQEN